MLYLLVPSGLVLLFAPLHTYRIGDIQKEFVFLRMIEILSSPPPDIPLMSESPSNEDLASYIFHQQHACSEYVSSVASITNSHGYPIISESDMSAHSLILNHIDNMTQMLVPGVPLRLSAKWLDDLPIEEWRAFAKKIAGSDETFSFQYGNRVFKACVNPRRVSAPVEVKGLKYGCKLAGGAFLLLALSALRGIYKVPSTGIQIGTRAGIILWDIICIGIGVIFTWGFIDAVLVKYFQVNPVWSDKEAAAWMGTFWVIFANPIMALTATTRSLQSVCVNEKGVLLTGLLGERFTVWSEVERIYLSELFSPRIIKGVFAPRRVTKTLKIESENELIRILEPPLSSTKEELINVLQEYAPEKLKSSISELLKEWLEVW